ncbi:MAG: hypothetical protein RLZZ179_1332 [Verrucomicrobiota bacterium]|jgi:hypothetical protein
MMTRILLLMLAVSAGAVAAEPKRLVFIAGRPSHPPLMHEFRAGSLLLEKCLQGVPGVVMDRHDQGWVKDEAVLEKADAVVIYADGGGGHPALQGNHLETLKKLAARGCGIGFMHYGVEVPADRGGPAFKDFVGGYYEHQFSCNPIWEPEFRSFPVHPVTRGVQPFQIRDEWYFNMRFVDGFTADAGAERDGVKFTPLLVAKPSDQVRNGPYVYPAGPYKHIQEAAGRSEAMMWAVERKDGGRGFGFTGGHFHRNWGNADFRRTILNALVWVAGAEVPAGGVDSRVSEEDLKENLDPK